MLALCLALGLTVTRHAGAADPARPAPASADLLSRQALEAYYDGRHEDAARLYHAAFARDPARPQFLYGAARAEHRAGQWRAAERDYRRVVALAGAETPLGVKARHHLAKLPADRSKVAVSAGGGATVMRRATAGRWTLVGSGAVLAVGLALGGWAWADQLALDEQTEQTTGGRVSGVAFADASARQAGINQRLVAAQALGVVALAASGVAAWLLWTDDAELAASVGPSGATLVARF